MILITDNIINSSLFYHENLSTLGEVSTEKFAELANPN